MSRNRVPVRHSLVTRLLATSVLIALAAIVATAWLAARTATRAISQEQGRSLTEDKGVYDMLVGYAATHADWSGAAALIDARAAGLGRRITLMAEDRAVLADSGPGPSLATARPSAVVDPLSLDLGLTGGTERIDARAVGPFRVPPAERQLLRKAAEDELSCLRRSAVEGKAAGAARIRSCVEKSRRAMLQAYVAPPALLFVTDPDTGADQIRFTLSTENTVRIVATTGAVLLATIIVTVLVGRRLVRPLRALTEAADSHGPAVVSTRDEIGRLARALNDSAGRRDRAEAQRRAMVSDVADELRTPLTNIRSWLEAAQDDLAPTDAQLLDLLHEEAVLLQHIIDDLSDLAAADADTLRIHPEPTYVRDVLGQVVDIHRGTAHAAGVGLTMEVRGDPVLEADAVRLRQLIGNLVSNAIRHTPPGGTVTVGAHDATITVRDTGTGIAAEHLPKIFDRFWRSDESRARSTGGSGLGLAIAQQLAAAHGGTISVESTPGRGSLFTVRLPEGSRPSAR